MADKKYKKINDLNNEITPINDNDNDIEWQQIKVTKETKDRVKKYSVLNDILMQEVADKAIRKYLNELDNDWIKLLDY